MGTKKIVPPSKKPATSTEKKTADKGKVTTKAPTKGKKVK